MKKLFRFLSSKEGLKSVAAYSFTAITAFLSFAPLSLPLFVWVSPFGLFYIEAKYRGEWKKLFYHSLGFALVFYTVSFHWIYHMTTVFGGFDWYLSIPIFIGSSFILNLKFPMFLLLFSFLVNKVKKYRAWIAAFCILFAEFFTPQVFPWYFGNVVAENLILAQNAEYTSAYGLSALLFFISYGLYSLGDPRKLIQTGMEVFSSKDNEKKAKLLKTWSKNSFVYILVFGLFYFNGYRLFTKWVNVKPLAQADVLVVQPNAPLEFRDGRNPAEEIRNLMGRIDTLTYNSLKDNPVDLIVLPESGVPFFTTHDSEATRYSRIYWHQFESLMAMISLRHGSSLFYNELDAKFEGGIRSRENLRHYNSSVVMSPNGERRESYQKVFLLIFGEYMPFEWMYALSGQTGRFAPGESLSLLPYYQSRKYQNSFKDTQLPPLQEVKRDLTFSDTDNLSPAAVREYYKDYQIPEKAIGRFLPLICYEVIISEFVRKFQGDPDFIVNVTNDKWYGNSVESYQHHTLGRLRTIEFRKWMVRSTNSGTSVFTDHLGRNIDNDFTSLDNATVIRKKVDVMPGELTFYRLYGNLLSYIFMGISSIFFVIYVRKSR